VFAALFPCGSITGAPKVRAMRAIRSLEAAPRGVYCGAIGVVRPGGAATFNVPIRTVTLRGTPGPLRHRQRHHLGLLWPKASGRSGATSRLFCERASAPFDILETLALDAGQLRHVDAHLARMAGRCRHFGYRWDAGTGRGGACSLWHRRTRGRMAGAPAAGCTGKLHR
jgi:para-aminobenzoate synthetase/4-amino-4-deoxychorismate lyase